jgi:hypothetical protein
MIKNAKIKVGMESSLLRRMMIKRTSIGLLTLMIKFEVLTRSSSIIERMILLFFPTMTSLTLVIFLTSLLIIHQKLLAFPFLTFFLSIVISTWLSSKILPIMSIITRALIMFKLIKWTKHCLKHEHIIYFIFLHFVNQSHLHLFFIIFIIIFYQILSLLNYYKI